MGLWYLRVLKHCGGARGVVVVVVVVVMGVMGVMVLVVVASSWWQ